MEKVFEALERLKTAPSFMGGTAEYKFNSNSQVPLLQDYELVKQALTELKQIKEAEPSEAFERLENLCDEFPILKKDWKIINQALLKAQEQEKVLEIIKELFDIQIIETDSKEMATITISRKDSNSALHFAQKLIKDKEKINLLKRWCEKCQK